ncbi:hypothetical protein [Bradyrhizobium sp. CCBAU 51627]|uniref:hypothetical protein n=1 Tax=Bradyrhizobium sp. CCBAU 51627 TaxID=1325088 RepID=UPI002305C66F|nr:hypothetical protein [Bradyrhizobium sp. CCBAU 51627]
MERSRKAAFSLWPMADRRWAAAGTYRTADHAASLESAEQKGRDLAPGRQHIHQQAFCDKRDGLE